MEAKPKNRSVLSEFCNAVGKILIILTSWTILSSFIEANWWHFTDPANTGINIPAAAGLLITFLLPPFLLFSKAVREVQLPPAPALVFTMFSPFILFLASLPWLTTSPAARTGLLAVGVFIMPLVVCWLLLTQPESCMIRRSTNCCCCYASSEPLDFGNNKTRSLGSAAYLQADSNNDLMNSERVSFSHPGVEFLIAVSLSMTIRWCASTVNLLYETWEASLVLLLCVFSYAVIRFAMELTKKKYLESSASRKSTASTVVSVDCSPEPCLVVNEVNVTVISHQDETQTLDLQHSLDSVNPSPPLLMHDSRNEESIIRQSPNDIKSTPTPITSRKATPLLISTKQYVVLWFCGIIHGLSIGTLLALFLWVFSTPVLLCRWSGVSPNPFVALILVFYAVGVVISAFQPPSWEKVKSNKARHTTKLARHVTWKMVFQTVIITIIVGAAATSVYFLVGGTTSSLRLAGASMLCVILPFMLTTNFHAVTIIAKFTAQATSTCLTILPGAVAFTGACAFFCFYLFYVMFINPQILSVFLGRMDIILSTQLAIASLSLFAFLLTGWSLKEIKDNKEEPSNLKGPSSCIGCVQRKIEPYKRPVTLSFLTIFCLAVGLVVGPTYTPNQCFTTHKEPLSEILNYAKSREINFNSKTFSVLSWNVLLGHDMNGRDNLPCLRETLKHVKADLIGFQESDALPPFWGGKDILGYLEGFSRGALTSYHGVPPLDSNLGVGILTEMNVTYHEANILPEDDAGRLPHYSVVQVDVRVESKTVHVFNIHAVFKNWTANDDNPSPFANVSRKHMEFVAEKVNTLNASDPVIVMGDFNLNPFESELEIMRETLGLKCALHFNSSMDHPSTLRNRRAIVDHIFYRGLNVIASKTLTETRNISDHSPVLAYFELPT
ncbi:unnamed protein product [Clavelina lepadiformis]|uniref:Endonuclease/exonuclease/phosphatase domain-containing protein n=1 Tax=Clavelina lepadiformis TaxID=159417 RepID=A0ABP0F4V8_CLALP